MERHPLLGTLVDPDPRRGIRFHDGRGGWDFHPYTELARAAFAAADRLRSLGVVPGDLVVLATGTGPEFVAAFLGTVAAGATPAPLAPPGVFEDADAHRRHAERMFASVRPKVVVTRPEWGPGAVAAGPGRPRVLTVTMAGLSAAGAGPQILARPPERALVQFTSGSVGRSKAVAVPAGALSANLAAVRRWLRMGVSDATATWLPFHHDMGLVGCLLTPLSIGADLWVMRPEDFVRTPLEWLRCFGTRGARLTASPAFGLEHVVRRVRAESLEGMDFSGWSAVITGAERVPSRTLRLFAALLSPFGFRSPALLPAYGLAEATLAVTGSSLDDEPRTLTVDPRALDVGRPVRPVTGGTGADGADTVELTGCGSPVVSGSRVLVTDRLGRPLPEGHVGEIVVGGPSVAEGYTGADAEAGAGVFSGGQIRTGDAGFLHRGELFVVGRLGDSLKCRATTVFAEDLEASVTRLPALRTAGVAVLLGAAAGCDTAVVIVERRPGPWTEEIVRRLRHRVPGLDVIVVTGPRGTVLRTSSGKPRRRAMWRAYLAGELGGTVFESNVLDVASAAPTG
ncbi:AMP-binding protein [Streptomyces sp. NPDC001389]|uniref:AMP-binding protein n=1 Tax=unclassified Streptomyces TaxID=2593676 RepID=UPI0036CA624F